MKIPISDIIIGERRREDMGNIEELAASINMWGLLHPIVIDDQKRLVAGERRLRACQSLGWKEIEVKMLSQLTDDDLREIELEENLRRKDLTEYERSKFRLELAKRVGERLQRTGFSAPSAPKPQGGRPEKPDSLEKIASEMGVGKRTLIEDKAFVQAADKYPELKELPKKEAIQTAKQLDTLPPEAKEEVIQTLTTQPEIKGDISFMLEPGYLPPKERVKRDTFLRLGNVFYKFSVIVNGVTQWKGMEEAAKEEEFDSLVSAYNNLQYIQEKITSWMEIMLAEINKRKGLRRVK